MSRPDKLVLATNNAGKLAELRRVVAASGLTVEVLGLADLPPYPEPEETERTFEGNAFLKADACVAATGCSAVADDSGIQVDELNLMPGVRSARWAGPDCRDEDNNRLLLRQLDGLPDERRSARFVCALAYVGSDGERQVFTGELPGRVAQAPAGEHGFGYDPLFVPDGHDCTTAQLTAQEKDAISHRGQAVRAFVAWLGGR